MAVNNSMASPLTESRGISKSVYFLTIAIVAVIGFVAGSRENELMGAIGPVFGLKVATGTIDTSTLQNTYRQLSANFDGKLDTNKLVEGASRGLVAAAGDQYTVYMSAEEARQFSSDLNGTIGGGIGAEIGARNGQPTILRVLADTPAEKAGLKAGDVFVKINDSDTNGWTADKTAQSIRGEAGTTVKLQVLRGEEKKEFTLTRAMITNPSVESSVKGSTGVLTISRFDEQTVTLARKAAEEFKRQQVRSVVLDLRGNGGGLLTAAQGVASLWLDNKVVVSERQGGKVQDELRSDGKPILGGLPTVVLVDGGSASASEIVAGALQDNGAAKLVGEKTFGKGTVQNLIELGDGAELKVTVARWYTPKGRNITSEGIQPDQKVAMTAEDGQAGRDPQMDAALLQLGVVIN